MKKGMNLQASPEMMAKATEGLSLSQADVKEIEQVKDQQDNLNKNKNDNQLLSLRKRLDATEPRAVRSRYYRRRSE